MKNITLGLRENWKAFLILVIVNAFVGGMVGIERSVFPKFAEAAFGMTSKSAILSFIIAFGISKAIANYFTGLLANRFGKKRILVFGWLIALPIPFILIYAKSWNWVVLANILLGISQGFTWSSTVVMKMDLVGPKNRGLAMGINEFAGYVSVGIFAFLSSFIAQEYGITPYPFYLGILLSILGVLFSIFLVADTSMFVKNEQISDLNQNLKNVFIETTFKNKTLSSVTQAGFINNLNDGMIWGLLPILLINSSFSIDKIGIITAIYPAVWGFGQLYTGKMSDNFSKKEILFWGMLLQALAIFVLPIFSSFYIIICNAAILGIGTALVYPTFLNTIASNTIPNQRAEIVGVFRFWRDLGYAFGAFISGIFADLFGIEFAIYVIAFLTFFSSLIIKIRMPN